MLPDLGIYENKNWDEDHKNQGTMISRLDKDVGHILDMLKKLSIDENTIVF